MISDKLFYVRKAHNIYAAEKSSSAVLKYLDSQDIPKDEQQKIMDGIYAEAKIKEESEFKFTWKTALNIIIIILVIIRIVYRLTS